MSEPRADGFGAEPRVVLVVVDNPAHRAAFRRHFSEAPHHLVFASDGEDGFDRFGEARPHLVIAHANVTRLDGTILCQLIRQQPGGKEVPVVLVCEDLDDGPEARARMAAVGADAHLTYPCTAEQLAACVRPLLEHGRPAPSPPQDNLQDRPPLASTTVGVSGQPTELTFGSMLEDFMSQTDEAAPDAEPAPPLEAITGPDASPPPLERAESGGGDMDTVVSFKNPFFEGDPPTSLEVQPVIGEAAFTPGAATIAPSLGQDEPPTPVGRTSTMLEPPVRPSSDLGSDQPVTELAKSPSGSVAAAAPPSPSASMPAVPPPRSVGEGSELTSARAPGPPEPLELEAAPRPDPLEEPKISGSTSGIRPRPEEGSGKSRLIREVPREITPSDDNRASQVSKRAAGQRRGLDESQLGKRLAKRVRTMHRLLDEVDYYQLLGLERSASPDALRRAYFDLSLEFHPDRFFLLRSGDLKEKIYDIYRRIAEAYRVLSDERRRRAYDEARSLSSAKRAAPELRGDSAAPQVDTEAAVPVALGAVAETDAGARFVDLANAAYERGDLNAARLHLVFAEAHEADNPTVRAALEQVARRHAPSV